MVETSSSAPVPENTLRTSDFDYVLPSHLIAQTPIEPRDHSRMMVVDRETGFLEHRRFFDIMDYLRAGDVLVVNDSRVIPARLAARKVDGGGVLEVLLLRRLGSGVWETLVKPAGRVKVGARIEVTDGPSTVGKPERSVTAETIGVGEGGKRVFRFSDEVQILRLGHVPLPPYIRVPVADPERYQTVYSRVPGSVAAPTAGLHFTPELMVKLEDTGVRCLKVTLHIGLDTFRPVRTENLSEHPIHREYGVLTEEVASEVTRAKAEGRRIICVGTTAVRVVEAAAQASPLGLVLPFADWVSLFIVPGYRFRMVDAMITNFHLPRSTTLMLAAAFAGKGLLYHAYREAISREYRFYSFGDAMLII
ncbi:MAG: tRNA preQ1(34) S-adenosylmethionine ribosyltransferase-isomerase QueA [Chloroflexi bacterium]|nr:tRNA preQ1(34) S-adenosylmethionine ribosyltransferase-isomerase QueA [Chloroflexota bacterium]